MVIYDARCTRKMKSRIAKANAAFNKKALFTSKFDLNLGNKKVKCYMWRVDFMVLKFGHFEKYIIITWRVLKC
jgi:hypothetical protein